jgi:eukaryotic-like serine/threonine-protein kinase
MALAAGSFFGGYTVVAPLGIGAMGEVYRARDTRLGREIALKVLPERFRLDRTRLARFTREAQVLASLNHPNIATLHDVGEEGDTQALVLELVEGETLADRLASGRVPVADSIAIAAQVAAALEAAHEHGIVHRDLKPANVKLRPDGTVKLLDFGLAKVVDPLDQRASVAAATITVLDLAPGQPLGTPAYMSPEQMRGQAVDQRGDVWAFGCVLYEMLSGQKAFTGATVSDSIAAVLDREPDWSALPSDCPPLAHRLLRHCLAKDRHERLRHIGDARIDLRDWAQPPAEDFGATDRSAAWSARSRSWRLGRKWVVAVVAFALGAASIAFAVLREPKSVPAVVARFEITPAADAPLVVRSYTRDLAISPDGRTFAYCSSDASLAVRALDSLQTTRLMRLGPEVASPTFSPDGRTIAFLAGAALKSIPVEGGPVTTIADVGEYTDRGATWVAGDAIVVASTRGLLRVSLAGGEPELLAAPDAMRGEKAFGTPEALPGGHAVLFTVRPVRAAAGIQIAVFDLDTRTRKDVLNGGTQPRYAATGHLVYATEAGTLEAVPFDLERREVRGGSRTVTRNVMVNRNGIANFAVSDNGTLVYVPGAPAAPPRLAWVTRDGQEELLSAPALNYSYPRLSPDGKRVALDIREPEGDAYVWDLERELLMRITFDPAENPLVIWHPQGQKLAFGDGRSGTANVYWQQADGGGVIERLTDSPRRQIPIVFTNDGTQLLFGEAQPTGGWDVLTLTLDEHRRIEPLLHGPSSEMNPVISPDGRWLAYSSDESGRVEVYVRPFPDVERGRWQVSRDGGSKPLWSRDGREIFFIGLNRGLMSAEVMHDEHFALGRVRQLFDATPYTIPEHGTGARPYDLSLDGQRFLMVRRPDAADDPLREARIVAVLNWFEELGAATQTR